MTDSIKPLPCPFCGTAAEPKDTIIGNPEVIRDGHCVFVNCFRCSAQGPCSMFTIDRSIDECEAEALQLWNQRAQIETTAVEGRTG